MKILLIILLVFLPKPSQARVFSYGSQIGKIWIQCNDPENSFVLGPMMTGASLDLYLLIYKNEIYGVKVENNDGKTEIIIPFKNELTQLKIIKSDPLRVELLTPLQTISIANCEEKKLF